MKCLIIISVLVCVLQGCCNITAHKPSPFHIGDKVAIDASNLNERIREELEFNRCSLFGILTEIYFPRRGWNDHSDIKYGVKLSNCDNYTLFVDPQYLLLLKPKV